MLFQFRAIPSNSFFYLSTYIDFTLNQLSPSSFSFSLLLTVHQRILPQSSVRSSYNLCYLTINRSLGFGSYLLYSFRFPIDFLSCTINKLADPLCKRYALRFFLPWTAFRLLGFIFFSLLFFRFLLQVLFTFPSQYSSLSFI